MRKSVKAKHAAEQQKKQQVHERHKRLVLWLSTVFIASLCSLLLSYTNWQVSRQVKAAAAVIADSQQQAKQYRAIAKINTAKRNEQTAALEIERQMQATGNSERIIASNTPTALQNSENCDAQNPDSLLAVISKQHCFSPLDWAPNDLENIGDFILRRQAAAQANAMFSAANNQGITFTLTSAYRSYVGQQATYKEWVSLAGDTAAADAVSARPGYSEHQTGLAIDLKTNGCALECFATTAAYQWLTAHAAEYGFIERYPQGLSIITGYAPEAWHWRYVGITAAKDMKTKDIKTLEQYLIVTAAS